MPPANTPSYEYYAQALAGHPLPLAYVDMDLLDENIKAIATRAGSKRIRIASKSVRCATLLRHILESGPQFQGLMCFTAQEAVFLHGQGFDDLLIAYPTVQATDLDAVAGIAKQGATVTLMTDSAAQLAAAQQAAERASTTLRVCMDLDLSLDVPGLHFGVWRSPVRTLAAVEQYLEAVAQCPNLTLEGLMGYEAQVAGVADRVPGQGAKNRVVRALKKRSIRKIRMLRAAAVGAMEAAGHSLRFVNGGGTGSLESTCEEACVTEVTAGSGFYQSHLFDYYTAFSHRPAAGFALQVVRQPKPGMYTCLGGGYIASGAVEATKAPLPYLPEGVQLTPLEGAGEVQTPLLYKGDALATGSPVFFRHSKAGELCERFNSLCLIKNGEVTEEVPTYRGQGQCFL